MSRTEGLKIKDTPMVIPSFTTRCHHPLGIYNPSPGNTSHSTGISSSGISGIYSKDFGRRDENLQQLYLVENGFRAWIDEGGNMVIIFFPKSGTIKLSVAS